MVTCSYVAKLVLLGSPCSHADCHRQATTLKTGQGALAQYSRVHADQLTHKPENIDFIHAAGISLAAMTAYQGLELAKIKEGQAIFVNGGSSSVGSLAIQIAKATGCKVVSSCSAANVELVKSLGADEVKSTSQCFFPFSCDVCLR
jgi:NADPH:quinone reductase-like Zn-dependent oxidoreductase